MCLEKHRSGQPTAASPGRVEGLLKRASEVGNAVCFRPKGEAEGGGEVKAIWGIFFFLAGFSAANSFCWGLKRYDWSLVQLETEASLFLTLSVSNFAKAKGFIYS